MTKRLKYFFLLAFSVIVVSCKVSDRVSAPRNLERIYDPSSSSFHPQIKIYNNSDSTSLIIERILTKELLYNLANPENKLKARIRVIYNLYDLNNKQALVDSSTTTFSFKKSDKLLYQSIEIDVNAVVGNNYILEVITTDLNRNSNQYSFFKIDRTGKHSIQDFLLYNRASDELLLTSYISVDKQIKVDHYKKELDSLHVFYFKNEFSVPPPPFMEDSVSDQFTKYDSVWICSADSVHYADLQNEGVYYFSLTPDLNYNKEGFTLFNFGSGYPVVRTPDDLAQSVIYLGGIDSVSVADTTGKLTKLAVDNFWLKRTNNIDKSRELLKFYYNRVMFANNYFTSYKEGWQTDRGMVYIIYGLPDYLFKAGDEERWIYNPNGIGPGTVFTFKYKKHPLTLNHFVLDREKLKSTGWDQTLKMWNTGEIFYYQN